MWNSAHQEQLPKNRIHRSTSIRRVARTGEKDRLGRTPSHIRMIMAKTFGQIIRHRKCGLVVDEEEMSTIVDGMAQLIKDGELRKRMATNALDLAKTEFDWQTMAKRYVVLQQDLMVQQGLGI